MSPKRRGAAASDARAIRRALIRSRPSATGDDRGLRHERRLAARRASRQPGAGAPRRARRRARRPVVTADRFMTVGNLLNQGRLMTEVALVALPMTFIIITGGIDLSVGSIMGLTAILLGVFWQNVGLPLPAAVAARDRRRRGVAGFFNGLLHHPPARAAADHDARDAGALSRARRGHQPGALGARLSGMVLRARPGRGARRADAALDARSSPSSSSGSCCRAPPSAARSTPSATTRRRRAIRPSASTASSSSSTRCPA